MTISHLVKYHSHLSLINAMYTINMVLMESTKRKQQDLQFKVEKKIEKNGLNKQNI